jgi:hypothetical protein
VTCALFKVFGFAKKENRSRRKVANKKEIEKSGRREKKTTPARMDKDKSFDFFRVFLEANFAWMGIYNPKDYRSVCVCVCVFQTENGCHCWNR